MIDHSGKDPLEIGIYIHIPFCKTKCNYCDFLSFLLPGEARVAEYILAVKKELELWAVKLDNPKAVSIYIGGGTPSIIKTEQLANIIRTVKEYYLAGIREFTLEANPGTLSREKLLDMKAIGVNRLSLGVQAMDDLLLAEMGRLHDRRQAVEAINSAREAGINNIGVDLIYGLPGQTPKDWEETLLRTAALRPEHISAYGLTLAPDTAWGKKHSRGELVLPEENDWAEMYRTCGEILIGEGYGQYEISNFAMAGYECVHNLGYWFRQPYIGIGLGASSFISETRCRNLSRFEDYLEAVFQRKLPVAEEETLDREQAMSETMFLGLRTSRGVDPEMFRREFGVDVDTAFDGQVRHLEKLGILNRQGNRLKLNPEYYPVSNEVFCRFLFPKKQD